MEVYLPLNGIIKDLRNQCVALPGSFVFGILILECMCTCMRRLAWMFVYTTVEVGTPWK